MRRPAAQFVFQLIPKLWVCTDHCNLGKPWTTLEPYFGYRGRPLVAVKRCCNSTAYKYILYKCMFLMLQEKIGEDPHTGVISR